MRRVDNKALQERFLYAYANGASVRSACIASGVSRSTVYRWNERDKAFAVKFEEAGKDCDDLIEDEILRRAVTGYQVPIVSMGKIVRDETGAVLMETRYSDSLLTLLAKARMQKYRERQQIDHSGNIDVTGAKELLLAKLAQLREKEAGQ